jgi:Mrp family chromosome partitioning ATPase
VSDAAVLASEVDLTMVVVQHRKLPRNMLMRVKQAVENVGGQVIGVVLNNVDVRSDSQYQYYTSYYTYYAPTALDEAEQLAESLESSTSAPARVSEPKEVAPSKGDDLY